ncbi:MAG: DUF4876 domain-containing protein [Calditrichia bacterium]
MKFVLKWFLTVAVPALLLSACARKDIVNVDSRAGITFLIIAGNETLFSPDSSGYSVLPNAEVVLLSRDYNNTRYTFYADSNGLVNIRNVVASRYEVRASYAVNTALTLISAFELELVQPVQRTDTLKLFRQYNSPLLINELYYCGIRNDQIGFNYFADQFVEIVNRSDSLQFLDGMILARISIREEYQLNKDELDSLECLQAYQFPGKPGGRFYPLNAGETAVAAVLAADHTQFIPNSVNLADADFEFVNQYGSEDDNPQVQNLYNLNPEITIEFYFNLVSGGIVLASGENWHLRTVFTPTGSRTYVYFPQNTVIDAVEYQASAAGSKYLPLRLDAGFTGVGISRYTGKSVQRIQLKDLNNSRTDFQILSHPTPGQVFPALFTGNLY